MKLNIVDLKTIDRLEEYVDERLNGASVEYDNDGQVVIYTGVRVTNSGRLRRL